MYAPLLYCVCVHMCALMHMCLCVEWQKKIGDEPRHIFLLLLCCSTLPRIASLLSSDLSELAQMLVFEPQIGSAGLLPSFSKT